MSIFRVWQSTGCKSFLSYRFKIEDVISSVETQRNYDPYPQSLEAKVFNNKVIMAPSIFLATYFHYFEPRYLLSLIGPMGILTLIISIYLIIQEHDKRGILHIIVIFFIMLVSAYFVPKLNNVFVMISLQSFSIRSSGFFAKNKKRFVIFTVSFFISLLYFFVNWQLPGICNEMFFS